MFTRKIKRDLMLAASVQFYQKLTGVVVVALMARNLPVETMGRFLFAVSVISFFALVSELGTTRYLIGRAAENPSGVLDDLAEVLTVRILIVVPLFLVLNSVAFILAPDYFSVSLLCSIYLFLQELYHPFAALFIGTRRVGYRAFTGMVGYTAMVAFVLLAIILNGSLETILVGYVFSNALLIALSVFVVRRRFGRVTLLRGRYLPVAKSVLADSFPFFLITVLSLLHFKLGALMLGALSSFEAVAAYEASNRLLEASRVLIRPVALVFVPVCTALALQGAWSKLRTTFHRIALIAAGLGVLLAAVVTGASDVIVTGLYGSEYAGTADVLSILFLSTPAVFLGSTALFLARSIHAERRALVLMAVSLPISLVLNLMLVPGWGAQGAAWATFGSQWILMFALMKLLAGELGRKTSVVSPQLPYGFGETDLPPRT